MSIVDGCSLEALHVAPIRMANDGPAVGRPLRLA
jgi:hypothetical protein